MFRVPPRLLLFFFNDTATTEIYTLSLHDALPIYTAIFTVINAVMLRALPVQHPEQLVTVGNPSRVHSWGTGTPRTEDRKSTRLNSSHQIISYAVFCLKKKNN